jgi:hypothetical protein
MVRFYLASQFFATATNLIKPELKVLKSDLQIMISNLLPRISQLYSEYTV